MIAYLKRMFRHITYCYLHCFVFVGRDERQIFCDYYIFLTIATLTLLLGGFFWFPRCKALLEATFEHHTWVIFGFIMWNMLTFLSAATRRGHDLDQSFWTVCFKHRVFGILLHLRLCREEGSPHANRFGPAPQANQQRMLPTSDFPDVWNG